MYDQAHPASAATRLVFSRLPGWQPPLPSARLHRITAAIETRVLAEVRDMARELGGRQDEPPFAEIVARASESLGMIARHLREGRVVPQPAVRVCTTDPTRPPANHPIRLGVFPVTGNPLHWGHLLCALESVAILELDEIVFSIQGIDERKPSASGQTQGYRHALAKEVIRLLEPLARYSDLGWGNHYIGEQNLFRMLRLNPHARIVAYYLVGADHYRLADAAGRPDTLRRLEQNMRDPAFGFDARQHEIHVVFVERGQRGPIVPTRLSVRFIPETLSSSSTDVRRGNVALAPHRVLRYLRRHPEVVGTMGLALPSRRPRDPSAPLSVSSSFFTGKHQPTP